MGNELILRREVKVIHVNKGKKILESLSPKVEASNNMIYLLDTLYYLVLKNNKL